MILIYNVNGPSGGGGHAPTTDRRPGGGRPDSLLETVSGGQHPLAVDQGASAGVAPALMQAGLPGPGPQRSVITPHYLGVEGSDTTNWAEMTQNSCFTEHQRLELAASHQEEPAKEK